MIMSARVLPFLTWHTCQIIIAFFFCHVVFLGILNKSRVPWLLSDALNFAISMSFKFRAEINSTTF
jgi:hypothetical protein